MSDFIPVPSGLEGEPGHSSANPMTGFIQTALDLEGFRVWGVWLDKPVFRIEVATTGESSSCPGCGTECRRVWERRRLSVLDLPFQLWTSVLEWRRRRFACDECGRTHFETHPEIAGEVTARYARVAEDRAKRRRISDRKQYLEYLEYLDIIGEVINVITRRGDLFESEAQTLVNAVNTVGVMGAGIALAFKDRFPEMFDDYARRCAAGEVKLGEPYLFTGEPSTDKWVLNFPTIGDDWAPTRLDDIRDGLAHLRRHYREWGITSLAMPALGCGVGGLDWKDVEPILQEGLSDLDIPVELYAPY